MGMQSIKLGDTDVIVSGGQESMSPAPHCAHLRNGQKMGDLSFIDTMIKDVLWDALNGYHMGNTTENVAEKNRITRQQQDEHAVASQCKAGGAMAAGDFKGEIVIDTDENLKPDTQRKVLAGLRPVLQKDGTVTAGNAFGIDDGASALVFMSADGAEKRGVEPLARIVSWATVGVDPTIMGSGPIPASQKTLKLAGWGTDDLELIEANEAFAAQACALNKGLGWDTEKVNIHGGAIALGHPIGTSGARVVTTLLYTMQKRDVKKRSRDVVHRRWNE